MERFGIYKILFGLAVVLFLIFNSSLVIDSIVAGMFIFSTIGLLFRREVSVDNLEDEILYPEVHHYDKSRNNPYTYSLVAVAVFLSLIFYILQVFTELRVGLISLLLWPIMILSTIYVSNKMSKNLSSYLLINYINKEFSGEEEVVVLLANKIINEKNLTNKEIDEIIKDNTDWKKSKRSKFIERFLEYNELLLNKEYSLSDEIEEINKNK